MKSVKPMLEGEGYLYAYLRKYYYLYGLTSYPNLYLPLRMLRMKATPLSDRLTEDLIKEEGKDEIN